MKAHFLAGLFSCLIAGAVWAQAQAPDPPLTTTTTVEKTVAPDKSKTASGNQNQRRDKMQDQAGVLDFEGELIEGDRKRPELFLQIGTQTQSMEAIVYGRKNFNDFHKNDKRRRPSFFEAKESGK